MSYTGKFDYKYIPEYIYSTKLELLQNRRLNVIPFENKNMLPVIFEGCEQPKTIIMCIKGHFFNGNREFISKQLAYDTLCKYEGLAFIKVTVNTNSGRGVRMLDLKHGIDIRSNEEISKILDNIGCNFVIQERVLPHSPFSKLYPDAVNTLRVITYMTSKEVKKAPIVMRIGQGEGVIDNAHAGGMFIGVKDSGKLLEEAFTESQSRYINHPDTGIVFKNYKIPFVPQIRETAITLHKSIPMFKFVSCNFTVDENDIVVLIEANLYSQAVWISQMAHGKSMFGNDTAELLQSMK